MDLTGEQYGRLTVLFEVEPEFRGKRKYRRWMCRCSCGNTVIVLQDNLRQGYTKSCGCLFQETVSKTESLAGKKFGKLTVLERVENSSARQLRWLCQCDCGNRTIVQGASLKNGTSKSCGCLRGRKRTKPIVKKVKKEKVTKENLSELLKDIYKHKGIIPAKELKVYLPCAYGTFRKRFGGKKTKEIWEEVIKNIK